MCAAGVERAQRDEVLIFCKSHTYAASFANETRANTVISAQELHPSEFAVICTIAGLVQAKRCLAAAARMTVTSRA